MKIIDLSVTISEEIKEPLPTKIVYEDHKEGAKKMGGKLFEGLTDVFIEGNGPAGSFYPSPVIAVRMWMRLTIISQRAKANLPERLMKCLWIGSSTMALSWILRTSPMAICLSQKI